MNRGVEEVLNCHGFYGFGGGWLMSKDGPIPGKQMYCGGDCPISQGCWDKHRERVTRMMPDAVSLFEDWAKELQGPELVKKWFTTFGVADPYTVVMMGNLQDGTAVESSGIPRDRDEWTVPWPFGSKN